MNPSSVSSSDSSTVQLTIPSSSNPVHIVVWQEKKESMSMDTGILERLSALEKMVQQLLELQTGIPNLGSRIPFFPESVHPLPDGIDEIHSIHLVEEEMEVDEVDHLGKEVHVIKLDTSSTPTVVKPNTIHTIPSPATFSASPSAEVEEVEEVEEEEAEAEEDGEALEEFEWKGVTYYRDSEQNVYTMDEDGDLQDEPIGRWHTEKQKVVRFVAKTA